MKAFLKAHYFIRHFGNSDITFDDFTTQQLALLLNLVPIEVGLHLLDHCDEERELNNYRILDRTADVLFAP